MPPKKKEYTSDFEIGNATLKEVAHDYFDYHPEKHKSKIEKIAMLIPQIRLINYLEERFKKRQVRKCIEDSVGMGYNGKWSVRVGEIAGHFGDFFTEINKGDNLELKKTIEGSKRAIGLNHYEEKNIVRLGFFNEDTGGFEDFEGSKWYNVDEVYMRIINHATLEEVSHISGYDHGYKESVELESKFFDDVVMSRTEDNTIDLE